MQAISLARRKTPSPTHEIHSIYNNPIIMDGNIDYSSNVVIDVDHSLFCVVKKEQVKEEWCKAYEHKSSDSHVFFIRPGCKLFLEQLFKYYRVGLFTYGSKEYLEILLNVAFLPLLNEFGCHKNDIGLLFSREHHDQCLQATGCGKKLSWIAFKEPTFKQYRTRIISTNYEVCIANEHWAIPLTPFRVDQEHSLHDTNLISIGKSLVAFQKWCIQERSTFHKKK